MRRICIATLLLAVLVAAPARGAEPTPDFDRDVAAVFASRCFDCHNAAEKKGGLDLTNKATALAGGENGAVILPGKPGESPLWKNVSENEMPPKHPLPAEEKETLRRWIASGAAWGTDPIDPFRFTTAKRAGYDWWSLQPLRKPAPPVPRDVKWGRNEIDAFILNRLEQEGLTPSPEADRRTLIRRLTFDLTGLPPTPSDVDAFVKDDAPDAYEKLVDRLLVSPDYGVRWARHWLDLVRFGESHGFERDQLRPNAWRYRDWVVDAFNTDLPYDQFVRMQLAGDVIKPGTAEGIIATGFLTAGAYDEVGASQQSAAMRAVVRQDELEDQVGTVSQTFLAMTANCARCHDHKFDPIAQKEYYQLAATLAGVKHGERDLPAAALAAADAPLKAEMDRRLEQICSEIDGMEHIVRDRLVAQAKARPRPALPAPILSWNFEREDSQREVTATNASFDAKGLTLDGKGYALSPSLKKDLGEKTLEVWVSLKDLAQRGGAAIGVQALDGTQFDAIVFGEREPGRWMAGSEHYRRSQSFEGPQEAAGPDQLIHFAVTYAADGTVAGYRNGQAYGRPYKVAGINTFAAGKSQFTFGLRHSPAGPGKLLACTIQKARVYDRALSADEIAVSAGVERTVGDADVAAAMAPEVRAVREQLLYEMKAIGRQQTRLQTAKTYTAIPGAAPVSKLLLRGNPAREGAVVAPAGIASIVGPKADFGLQPDAPDADRRLKLAEWITSPSNPLFARAMVNRLWLYHFGNGIVETPNDFGFNGGRPSHPELLDYLASEFAASGWSIKQVQKRIVMSAAYRQASLARPEAMLKDAGNRLLWRMSPRRVEAEALRDAVLAVSGALNPQRGGPGYEDYFTFTNNSTFYEARDYVGDAFNRRSLYRTWVRSGRSPMLDVFDCPDPSTKTPRRAVTTTPLQALALMNDSFILRMSDTLAARAKLEAGEDGGKQITSVYELLYNRRPNRDELEEATVFVEKHGLSAFCRVVLNSSEFVTID